MLYRRSRRGYLYVLYIVACVVLLDDSLAATRALKSTSVT